MPFRVIFHDYWSLVSVRGVSGWRGGIYSLLKYYAKRELYIEDLWEGCTRGILNIEQGSRYIKGTPRKGYVGMVGKGDAY